MNQTKKNHRGWIWILPVMLLLPYLLPKKSLKPTQQKTVAITQIIEHPALDQEREGILEALREAGYVEGKNLRIIYQNAQGSSVTATQIAQSLLSSQPDVVVAISTPSAQTVLSAIRKTKVPLVFTAVTDPVGAKLVKSLDHPGAGVTGISDHVSPDPQLKLVKKLVPHLKKLGVIYNPGESNSGSLYQELKMTAPSLQIELVAATASRTSEVASAAQSLVGKVDAIFIPNDNTAVSAIESIVRVGVDQQIPVFAGDTGSVLRGAVGVAGYNRKALGRSAGAKVVQILKAEGSLEIRVEDQHPVEITLNRGAAKRMRVKIPSDLPEGTLWIEEDSNLLEGRQK